MAHPHPHGSLKDYFTEQLLTLLVCGLFGFAAVQLYMDNKLNNLLVPRFFPWVLAGGIAILAMVVLRGIAVWKEAGDFQAQAQSQSDAGISCTDCTQFHIPGQEDYDHDHPHNNDLSWMFARMLILFFPVGLFFLGLPNPEAAAQYSRNSASDAALNPELLKEMAMHATVIEQGDHYRILKTESGLKIKEVTQDNGSVKLELMGGDVIAVRFNELNDATLDPGKRDYLSGKTAILEGRFKRLADKEFSLYRYKMTCCYADAVPLKVRIIVPQALSGFGEGRWVRVKGQIQFLKVPGQDSYIPVLMVADVKDIESKPAPMNESE